MIIKLLVIGGIILLTYSIYLCIRLITLLNKDLIKQAIIVLSLVLFFLIGYISYFYFQFTSLGEFESENALISSILFFGAVFVVIVLSNDLKIIKSLNEKTKKLTDINRNLKGSKEELEDNKSEIERTKKELEKKNKELEETLEDFYTMRVKMSPNFEYGDIKKENEDIKRRIEQLRKKHI